MTEAVIERLEHYLDVHAPQAEEWLNWKWKLGAKDKVVLLVLKEVAERFPALSLRWLLFGEGEENRKTAAQVCEDCVTRLRLTGRVEAYQDVCACISWRQMPVEEMPVEVQAMLHTDLNHKSV